MRRAPPAPGPWGATPEPVLEPPFPMRVGRNVAFGERGGGRSGDGCAGGVGTVGHLLQRGGRAVRPPAPGPKCGGGAVLFLGADGSRTNGMTCLKIPGL